MSSIGGVSGLAGAMMPQATSGASMRMPPSQKMSNLFQQIDTGSTGSITKAQFEQAFQTLNPPPAIKAMGADAVFSKLDSNGTGSVSRQDFINGMKSIMVHNHPHRHNHAEGAPQTLGGSINAMNNLPQPAIPAPTATTGNNINTAA